MTRGLCDADLERFRSGDEEFFARIVRARSPMLRAVARRRGLSLDEADDVVQETWIRAWEQRATFANRGALDAWLARLCHHMCIDALRADRSRRKRLADLERTCEWHPVAGTSEAIASGCQSQRITDWVDDQLITLPPLQFRAAALRWLFRWSIARIAQYLDVRPGTVKAALFRARGTVSSRLGASIAADQLEPRATVSLTAALGTCASARHPTRRGRRRVARTPADEPLGTMRRAPGRCPGRTPADPLSRRQAHAPM